MSISVMALCNVLEISIRFLFRNLRSRKAYSGQFTAHVQAEPTEPWLFNNKHKHDTKRYSFYKYSGTYFAKIFTCIAWKRFYIAKAALLEGVSAIKNA